MTESDDRTADEVHEALLRAATELVAEEGPTRLSVRKVAQRASVTAPMVNYYYGSKEELLEAVLDQPFTEITELQTAVFQRQPECSNTSEFLALCVRESFRFTYRWRTAWRLNLMLLLDRGFLHQRRQDRFQWPMLDNVAKTLSSLCSVEEGDMRVIIQSVVFTIVRFALLSEAETRQIMRADASEPLDDVLARVEEHLVAMTLRLMTLPPVVAP